MISVFRSQKLENVSIALKFLEAEGVHLVNIDSTGNTVCFFQKLCSFDQLKIILQRPKTSQNLCLVISSY